MPQLCEVFFRFLLPNLLISFPLYLILSKLRLGNKIWVNLILFTTNNTESIFYLTTTAVFNRRAFQLGATTINDLIRIRNNIVANELSKSKLLE